MSKLTKIGQLYQAIRPIPPQRHVWRIIRRSQRKLYALHPSYWHRWIASSSARLECQAHVPALQALAELRRQHESNSASSWVSSGPQSIELELHGQRRQIPTGNPCDPVFPEVSNLWRMSSSYMGYMLVAHDSAKSSQIDHVVGMCRGIMGSDAWQVPGVFDRQWHPYAASHRLLNLICARTLFAADMSGEQCSVVDEAIRFHTRFISMNNEYDIHFNHLAKNLLSLIVSAAYRTGKIPTSLFDEYRRVFDYQLLPDGGHAELCPMYHLQVLADLQLLKELPTSMVSGESSRWLESTVTRMQSAASTMSFSSGEIALFGDSWLGECPSARQLGVTPAEQLPDSGAGSIVGLPQTGYTKIQSKRLELILDNGHAGAPENPGHAHDDYLSVEIAVAGERWVLDYGVGTYEAGQARDKTRSAQRHNGPTFDHAKGLDGWGSFRIGARRDAPLVARRQLPNGWEVIDSIHTPLGEKGIQLVRSIAVNCDSGLAIVDRWTGVANSRHPRSTFLLTRDADFLTEHGLHLQAVQGNWTKQSDTNAFQVIGVPVDVTEWVLEPEPESDTAMLLITDQAEYPASLSTFLLQAITQ